MRDHLSDRPVRVAVAGARESHRRKASLFHLPRLQLHLELEVNGALCAIDSRVEVRKRLGILRRSLEGHAKGRKRF
jgi:hypothetical protein